MTEGWDDVIMHLVKAQQIAAKLPRNRYWRTYVDEIDCDAALGELIESARSELPQPEIVTLPNGHTSTCTCGPDRQPDHVHPFVD